MESRAVRQATKYYKARQWKKRWRRVVVCLAAIVVSCTTYALILPAITMERDVSCGEVEHIHSEDCYENVLVCTLEETEGHAHSEDCYEAETKLICGQEETEGHSHTENCYDEDGNLSCGLEEAEGHIHTEECYGTETRLICGQEETEGHSHSEDCYESVLTCGYEEHTHTLACYSNPDADVETAEDWENTLTGVELSGVWTDDLIAIAESQLGYAESTANYVLTEDGETKGYTRYGAWYGLPYEDWCAMFISFCLNYAEIPADLIPRAASCQSWIDTLASEEWNLYVTAADNTPAAGDLVFFDTDGDDSADHVGIVAELIGAAELKTIEGNSGGKVQYVTYDMDDESIMGYAVLPANPEIGLMAMDEDASNSFQLTYGDYTITFHVVSSNGEPIPGSYKDITAAESTKYVFGTPEPQTEQESGNVTEISIPAVDGYDYSGAKLNDYASGSTVASVATTGYVNCNGDGFSNAFQFYITEPMTSGQWYSRGDSAAQTFDVYLTYTKPVSVITDAVSPSGTVINLFDYWATEKVEDEFEKHYTEGINQGHALKFKPDGLREANGWTGSKAVYPGIVANSLGEDGYPALSGEPIFGDENGELVSSTESLAYLFDPAYTDASSVYRDAYRNVTGLLQINEGGYYYYDSTKNYAEFDEETNHFTLYDDWAVTYTPKSGTTNAGQFFPFNEFDTVSQSTNAQNSGLNHYFGMTLTARFIQQYGGHTDPSGKTDMIFDFSGDDDVWIFIDGVLVADLGGIHDAASVDINFSTGAVTINGTEVTTIKNAFITAGQATEADTEEWNGNIFADETYHTLKFYYLERGSYASNLKLTYNLNSYPSTSVYKVNQYGDTVEGATFAVYAADSSYNILADKDGETVALTENSYTYDAKGNIVRVDEGGNATSTVLAKALYIGTTDGEGEMVFLDEDGVPYTLAELENMFGERFILKEIEVPMGYRLVSDTIKLRIYNHKILMCDNTYTSGVYAAAALQASAPATLKKVNGDEIEYVKDDSTTNGILFAVVLKYIGPRDEEGNATDLTKQSGWAPVYGTDVDGFTIVDVAGDYGGDFVEAVIDTAGRYVESQNVFSLSHGGQMQGQINGMPGDITSYYYMLTDANKSQTQYTVAYYWSEAESLKGATSENTFRIDADAEGYALTRSFGATIAVPNLLNRLIVQKLDSEGGLVNGATFALYEVEEAANADGASSICYVGYKEGDKTKTLICLGPDDGSGNDDTDDSGGDTAGNNKGRAKLAADPSWTGSYEIFSQAADSGQVGDIRVTIGETAYTIRPVDTAVTLAASDTANTIGEDGTANFTNMDNGYYYLREIAAPVGYALNVSEVMVLVDDTAVYANAGTPDDGVTVARGPGYVVSTLDQFASQGKIDNTLSWVYEQMLVSPESTSFADVYDALKKDGGWEYLQSYTGSGYSAVTTTTTAKSDALTTYLVYDKGGDNTLFNYTVNAGRYANGDITGIARRLYTSVGWSYYLLYQDYDYGLAYLQKQDSSANYTDLNDQEISNLFSRSTFVQVADENETGTLEIRKTVESAPAEADNTAFAFTVDLKDAHGNALTGSYRYTVWTLDADGTKREPVKNSDGMAMTGVIVYDPETGTCSGTIYLTNGQAAVLEGIPYATRYTVTETQNTRYSTTAIRDKGKAPIAGIANTGEQAFIGNAVHGTLYWVVNGEGTLDSTSTVDYVNAYLDDLVLWKVDAADPNATLAGAEFTLTKDVDGKMAYYTADGWSNTYHTLTTNENGYIQLDRTRLTDNGTYTLTEIKPPDGYYLMDAAISVEMKDGQFEKASVDGDESTELVRISDDRLSLIVSNTSSYELPDTGGAGVTLCTLSGIALMSGALSFMYIRRRRTSI